MREPTLFHVETWRHDAWFLNTDDLWFVSEDELNNVPGSHRRDNELVVSNTRPIHTNVHPPWDQSSSWAPSEAALPSRVDLNDVWWGWWTDDLTNVSLVPLSDAPLPVYRAFWDRARLTVNQ